jgi:hypothetical protein
MAEGLAAIGLVGNIVQFISFSYALISKSAEIHKSATGLLSESLDLDVVSHDLRNLTREIACSSERLRDIASRCRIISDELIHAISQLKGKQQGVTSGGRPTKWQSFRKALKSVWTKGHIDELKSRLELLRDQMTLHLVSNTRSVIKA